MKNLSFVDKILFIINNLMAFSLVLSYFLPFFSPEKYEKIAIISLVVPLLIFANVAFALFWMIKIKKQFLLSFIVLLIGFKYVNSLYKIADEAVEIDNSGVTIMNYNVRMFNLYQWIDDKTINSKIISFIKTENPDILCLQEYHASEKKNIAYPHNYIKTNQDRSKIGQAIFSKYKIINSGSLNFEFSGNNAIFADIVIKKDTIRVYNIHLESLKINPLKENFGEKDSDHLRRRFEKAFKKQVAQTNLILEHQMQSPYKTIISGDFNNTQFSWVYREMKKGKNDAFEEHGSGFGKTFNYPFPLRIDYLLIDETIEINQFKTYSIKYSDHFPIMARIEL